MSIGEGVRTQKPPFNRAAFCKNRIKISNVYEPCNGYVIIRVIYARAAL